MTPLKLEIYTQNKNWIKVGELRAGDQPGSVSDNKPDGSRDVYMFECSPDDSKSTIYRSKAGIDTEIGPMRTLTTVGAEVIKELKRGGDPYEMRIKTDKSPEARLIRFTHV
jgi:hypothetical protein